MQVFIDLPPAVIRRACVIARRVGCPVDEVLSLLLADMLASGSEEQLVARFVFPNLPFLGVRR